MQVWLAAPQNASGPQVPQPVMGPAPSEPQPIPATPVTASSSQRRRFRPDASAALKDRALAPGRHADRVHLHAEGLSDAQIEVVVRPVPGVDQLTRLPGAAAATGDDEGGVVLVVVRLGAADTELGGETVLGGEHH